MTNQRAVGQSFTQSVATTKRQDSVVNKSDEPSPTLGLRGGADIRSEEEFDADVEAAISVLPDNLDDDDLPGRYDWRLRRHVSNPPYYVPFKLRQPNSVAWLPRRAVSQPILEGEEVRTTLAATTRANSKSSSSSDPDGLMMTPTRRRSGLSYPVDAAATSARLNGLLNGHPPAQQAPALQSPAPQASTPQAPAPQTPVRQRTSLSAVPEDVVPWVPPRDDGEPLTPEDKEALQVRLRGGGALSDHSLQSRLTSETCRHMRRVHKWFVTPKHRQRGKPGRTNPSPMYVDGEPGRQLGDQAQYSFDTHSRVHHRKLFPRSTIWSTATSWSATLLPRPKMVVHTLVPLVVLTPPSPGRLRRDAEEFVRRMGPLGEA